jgi:hypothetical protein
MLRRGQRRLSRMNAWYAVVVAGLALQGTPVPAPLPVTVYPVLGHGRDSLPAVRLTRAIAHAFRADSTFVLVQPRPTPGSRMREPRYGVVTGLRTTGRGRLRLAVRVVDVPGVYLVARDSVTGSLAEIERTLPVVVARAARRLTMLQWAAFSSGPPPSWLIPTDALELYARALEAADRGDTTTAVASLHTALSLHPSYHEACEALRRLGEDRRCQP